MRASVRAAHENGWLWLAFLEIDGQKAAAALNFDYGNRLWGYNSGVDRRFLEFSPGWVLLAYTLQWAAEHGRLEFVETVPFGASLSIERYSMQNGLSVLLCEDKSAPVVSVHTWFRVGSRHEVEGKTGLAHLFEHLMFNGTENLSGDYFTYLQQIGATGVNGTTSFDRTNYFETVPTGALERTLFMESDRMGHLLENLDDVLDEAAEGRA